MIESVLFFIAAGIWMLATQSAHGEITQICNAFIEVFLIMVAWWQFFNGKMR